jgi:hypothetical protein
MDHDRFDALIQAIGAAASRRNLARAVLGGGFLMDWPLGARDVDARRKGRKKKKKKKTLSASPPPPPPLPPPPPTASPLPLVPCVPDCAGRVCGRDGCGGTCGDCPANEICQSGSCVCAPEPPARTCAGRCGIWPNNCGQFVACPGCPAGRTCLSNGTCAIDCPGGCPLGCVCTASVEGPKHCAWNPATTTCTFRKCTSTAQCNLLQWEHCQETLCGPGPTLENQCWPLC